MILMELLIVLMFGNIAPSFQVCHTTQNVQEDEIIKILMKEMNFKNPVIYDGISTTAKKNKIKSLSTINQFTSIGHSMYSFEKRIIQTIIYTYNGTKSLIDFDGANETLKLLENFTKGIVILNQVKLKDIEERMQLKLHQEFYFYESLSCSMLETYMINNFRITNYLGSVRNLQLIWNANVSQR